VCSILVYIYIFQGLSREKNRLCLYLFQGSSSVPNVHSYVVGLPNNSYKCIINTAWVRNRLCKLEKWCTRLVSASDKVYQLLGHGRWFSSGITVSSTTKTGRVMEHPFLILHHIHFQQYQLKK
jgi:hypothetical protein